MILTAIAQGGPTAFERAEAWPMPRKGDDKGRGPKRGAEGREGLQAQWRSTGNIALPETTSWSREGGPRFRFASAARDHDDAIPQLRRQAIAQ